nr:MAG TPA: hypothetical protein [Caudoviricetes sp.]
MKAAQTMGGFLFLVETHIKCFFIYSSRSGTSSLSCDARYATYCFANKAAHSKYRRITKSEGMA